jgi:hypothetical protein
MCLQSNLANENESKKEEAHWTLKAKSSTEIESSCFKLKAERNYKSNKRAI